MELELLVCFFPNPRKEHCTAVKWIFKYLRGTSKVSLSFENGKPILLGFIDADMVGDIDPQKSTSGYLITFVGGVVHGNLNYRKMCSFVNYRG